MQKMLGRGRKTVKNRFPLHVRKLILPKLFSFPIPFWIITHESSKNLVFQQAVSM